MTLDEALAFATDTRFFETGDVLESTSAVFRRLFPTNRPVVVADENTYAAAGARVEELFRVAGLDPAEPFVFPGEPILEPDYENVAPVRDAISADGLIAVAVGSGTLNDIVKVAAFEEEKRYIVCATAASVDGYTSPGASMIVDGFKNSISCQAPAAVIADSRILAGAPSEMNSAGYADLASKLPAGTDWIIADFVGADPIDETCWKMIQHDILDWLDSPASIPRSDPEAIGRIMYGLTLTGIGMQYLRRSRPASGAEHLMSHVWEMDHHTHRGMPVSHGFQVAVGTLACTAFAEVLFKRTAGELPSRPRTVWPDRERAIRDNFGSNPSLDRIISESRAKYISNEEYAVRIDLIRDRWDELVAKATKRFIPYDTLKEWFAAARCPVSAADIGLEKKRVTETFRLSGMIRNRYTVIDLAEDLCILDEIAEEVLDSPRYL